MQSCRKLTAAAFPLDMFCGSSATQLQELTPALSRLGFATAWSDTKAASPEIATKKQATSQDTAMYPKNKKHLLTLAVSTH